MLNKKISNLITFSSNKEKLLTNLKFCVNIIAEKWGAKNDSKKRIFR